MGLEELRRDLGMDAPDVGPKRPPKGGLPMAKEPPVLPPSPPVLDEAPAPLSMPSAPSLPVLPPAPNVGLPAPPPALPSKPVAPPDQAITPSPEIALRDYMAPGGTKVRQQIGNEVVEWTKTDRNEWQGWVGGVHRKLTGESALNMAASPPKTTVAPVTVAPGRGMTNTYTPPTPPPLRQVSGSGNEILGPGEAPPLQFNDPKLWQGGKPPFDPTLAGIGNTAVQNAPDIATNAVLGLMPGVGLAKSVLRGLAATGAGVGTAGLTGQSMEDQAVKSGLSSVVGEGVGGAARAAARWGQGAFSQTTKNFGDLVGKYIPSFKGATPQETVAKLVNGTGYNQLGKDYGTAVQGVLAQHGDPVVMVPTLDRFGKSAAMPASKALETIQSLRRSLFSGGGDLGRSADAMQKAGWIEDAMREWQDALGKQLPAASMKVMDVAKSDYARGMSVLRLMGEGHEHMSKGALDSLIQKGRINEPGLEQSFLMNAGKMKERFTPEEYAALEQAIRRGEPNPLAMSQVGKPSRMSMTPGARMPHMSIPHAPVRIGRPEEVADLVSRVFRLLGAGGAQGVLSE